MDLLDRKVIDNFPGMIVRKDLSSIMKKGANVPTYVLEYLLGQQCSSEDEDVIKNGMEKIKTILSQNYVTSDQSEYIKSRIRENGVYTIIDKISVKFDEKEDKYVASFHNFSISPFEVASDLVIHNDKLLLGGIWCIVKIEYTPQDENEEELEDVDSLFGNKKAKKQTKKKRSIYDSPFSIVALKPIQMPNLNLDLIKEARANFTKEEWINLILRSAGYEPTEMSKKEKFHYLLRFVPMIQKNYNLVELGPRGTGKSHVYSELSPYSILLSGGHTTVANLFGTMYGWGGPGLVSRWDCIAFDEVGGMKNTSLDAVQIMKNYMANGTYARGKDSVGADASMVFGGNTFRSVAEMIRTTHLFEPFPDTFNNDSAFFDRMHAYLPGWETPKLRASLFTNHFGLISDCFAEFCHGMRNYDFTNNFAEYYEFNKDFNVRDDQAVRRTFSGLVKLIYPNGEMTKEEVKEILVYAIECRRRVKEQLKKMTATEFNAVNLGIIDLETNEEIIPTVPEQACSTLIYEGFEPAGYVYGIGTSINGNIAVYRLENKLIQGTGEFKQKNIEGIGHGGLNVKKSLIAAFNYFGSKCHEISRVDASNYDYSLFYNDLQNKGISEEISVAEVVGLCSALASRSINPSTVIVGRVVMSGTMMPITASLSDILVVATNAGAKNVLLPEDCKAAYDKLNIDLTNKIKAIFYKNPIDAAKKALGMDN